MSIREVHVLPDGRECFHLTGWIELDCWSLIYKQGLRYLAGLGLDEHWYIYDCQSRGEDSVVSRQVFELFFEPFRVHGFTLNSSCLLAYDSSNQAQTRIGSVQLRAAT